MAIKFLIFLCLIFTYMSLSFSKSEDLRSFVGRDDTPPEVEESHVVALSQSNFGEVIEKNKFVMVDFYVPWCRYSQALAPEYAAAAAELKDEAVVLGKVNSDEEGELRRKFHVQGFPTISFFVNGILHRSYYGQRTKDAIVCWLKKRIAPGLNSITTMEEAFDIFMFEDKLVLAYVHSLVGHENEELAAASKLEDDFNFYQTTNPNVAKLFYIDPKAKRPSLVLLKQHEANHINQFSGEFTKTAIAEFVLEKKLSLLTNVSVLENSIKKPIFGESAKLFKGKLRKWLIDLF